MSWRRDVRGTYEFLALVACVFFRVPFWAPYARWTCYWNWWHKPLGAEELATKMHTAYLTCDFAPK